MQMEIRGPGSVCDVPERESGGFKGRTEFWGFAIRFALVEGRSVGSEEESMDAPDKSSAGSVGAQGIVKGRRARSPHKILNEPKIDRLRHSNQQPAWREDE